MNVSILAIILLSCVSHSASGARFLLLAHQFGSHMMINNAIAEELPKNGHEVYVALGTSIKEPPAVKKNGYKVLNFHHPGKAEEILDMDKMTEMMQENYFKDEIDFITPTKWSHRECELIMEDTNFINKVKELKFDMVILDLFILGHCLEMLPYTLGIPFVSVAPHLEEDVMRVPQPASFVPSGITEITSHMTYRERLVGFGLGAAMSIPALNPFTLMRNTTLLRKYVKDPAIQHYSDMSKASSLFFVCSGPIAEPAAPLMPNIICIEGITAHASGPLNEQFETLVTNAQDGVVVVSFGSSVRNLPIDIVQRFMDGFGKRKELFLWRLKIKKDSDLTIPSNVKIFEWLPQNDLLGNANIKLFITHSGNNGRYEAIYHGVPMLAFPLFGDQPHNAVMIEEKGFGIKMKLPSFTTQELVTNMGKILDGTTYHDTIKKASAILKSKPMNARQEAAYWLQHVVTFGGSHLRNEAAMAMPFYQYAMWDIYGLIYLVISIVMCASYFLLKCICRTLFSKKEKPKKE